MKILIDWQQHPCPVYWFDDNDGVVSYAEKKATEVGKMVQAEIRRAGSGACFPIPNADASVYTIPDRTLFTDDIESLYKKALAYKQSSQKGLL